MPTRKRILVVEDERPLLEAITDKLEASGFDYVTARSVSQALHALEDIGTVDAVWTDHYLLNKSTGIDLVRALRADRRWHTVPIFLVSVTASEEKLSLYRDLGVNYIYAKHDVRLDQIVKDIKKILGQKAEGQSGRR